MPLLRRFIADERGSLTMEFVLWIPILGFWFALSVAAFDAYKSRNEAAKAANTLADIISRQETVDQAFLDDMHLLTERLLPRVHGGEQLRVTSISFDLTDGHSVEWSRAMGGGMLPLTDAELGLLDLPTMADGDTVILTEVDIPWDPVDIISVLDPRPWRFNIIARPRFVRSIDFEEPTS